MVVMLAAGRRAPCQPALRSRLLLWLLQSRGTSPSTAPASPGQAVSPAHRAIPASCGNRASPFRNPRGTEVCTSARRILAAAASSPSPPTPEVHRRSHRFSFPRRPRAPPAARASCAPHPDRASRDLGVAPAQDHPQNRHNEKIAPPVPPCCFASVLLNATSPRDRRLLPASLPTLARGFRRNAVIPHGTLRESRSPDAFSSHPPKKPLLFACAPCARAHPPA